MATLKPKDNEGDRTMNDIKQVDDQLNEMTSAGQILEALERFYAEDCTFQEGNKEPQS